MDEERRMTTAETYLDQRETQSLEELKDFLRIASISSLPDHAQDVQRAAEWTADRLREAGLEHIQIMPTGGHPVVYGDWLHAEGKPTVLIYGHFDVQPVDPVDLWSTPPFDPQIRNNRIYARGATDMKANLLMSVLAVESHLKGEGTLPVNVKFILEGQEEIGSPQLPDFVARQRDLLACDIVISGDGGQFAEDQPALLIGLKGGCACQIDVEGANSDLHSGLFGGAVANPIHALVHILDTMRSPDGKILVEGFYDDIPSLTDEDRASMAEVPFDEASYKAALDVDALVGEPGYTPLEQLWARPTLEINGIWGGFQGEGVKTVLPRLAHAKITCRLVPDQKPAYILDLIQAHVEKNATPGVRVHFSSLPFRAMPYFVPRDFWGNEVAASVLTEIYGRRPFYIRMGGSVPVCETFLSNLDAYTVGFGFGLSDERMHAPDEFLRLDSFERGQKAWSMLLTRLGEHARTQ
jgi:acetylornithine deacetylase/succinyl-diaminopimelate desuccinylase-like protein